jgi:hypothetical protein
MSLGETQQIFQLLTEIDKLLGDIQVKVNQIENTGGGGSSKLMEQYSDLNRAVRTYLRLANKPGIGGDVGKAITLLSQLVAMLYQAQVAYTALLSATGIGFPIALAGIIMTGLTAGNLITGMTGYR